MSSFFYSGQIRRFLQQFIRLVSNFEVQLGRNRQGITSLMRVPVYYGDSSRQVASILNLNSENNLPVVPAMTVVINGIKYDRNRVQEPYHVGKVQVRQRAYDPTTGDLSQYQGDMFTVERMMPVPYLLTLKLDIWCSNTEQKLQLLEQISVLFNPSLELQSSDSYVDWTSLTYITLTDITWSSRSIPMGTEDAIDVLSYTFELPIWISAPAKVKRMGVIQKIIASVYDPTDPLNQEEDTFDIQASVLTGRRIFTPIDLNVLYLGNYLKLYVSNNQVEFNDGVEPSYNDGNWHVAIQGFGELANAPANTDLLVNGISQIRLENDGLTVVGTVAYHPTDATLLIFNVDTDTLPVNSLSPITAIIDPYNLTVTTALSSPTIGARYLILNPIGDPANTDSDPTTVDGAALWNRAGEQQLIANANDIIEWNGTRWFVAFDSAATSAVHYVSNLTTGVQYKWKNQQWTKSVQGLYGVGAWSFVP